MGSPLRQPNLHSQLKFFKSCLCLMGLILGSFLPHCLLQNINNINTSHLSDTLEYIKVLYHPFRATLGTSITPISLLRLNFKVTHWLGIDPPVELVGVRAPKLWLPAATVGSAMHPLCSPLSCPLLIALPLTYQHTEALLKVPGLNKRTDYFSSSAERGWEWVFQWSVTLKRKAHRKPCFIQRKDSKVVRLLKQASRPLQALPVGNQERQAAVSCDRVKELSSKSDFSSNSITSSYLGFVTSPNLGYLIYSMRLILFAL